MRSFTTFVFLTAVSFIVLQLLLAYQLKLVIERLDAIETERRSCDMPVDEPAAPQRPLWPVGL